MALYLVTGGCGFIGSHLADELLRNGHDVRILDNLSTGKLSNLHARSELVIGDVSDPDIVQQAMQGVAGCFHLAAVASVEQSNLNWLGTHKANLTGTINVLNAARPQGGRDGVPVVYASSAAVYGDNFNTPLVESAEKRPLSAYGADKLGSEQHAFVASKVHKVPTCGLRFFNVYGPRQDPTSPYSGVISIFFDRISAGQGITIFGDGQQTRDFVFVADVVQALQAAMRRASMEAKVYNVCTGRETSVLQLAYTVARVLGVSVSPVFAPARSGEVRCSLGNPRAALQGLDFEARTRLETGLQIMRSPLHVEVLDTRAELSVAAPL